MRSLRSFIAKNLAAFTAFIVCLFAVNAILFVLVFSDTVSNGFGDSSPSSMLDKAEAASDSSGMLPAMQERLSDQEIWAIYIAEGGDVAWSVDAPANVPVHYSLQDVAAFSKGYIADYPVFTRSMGEGLLVLGYPPDSYAKIVGNYYPVQAVRMLPGFIAALIALDVLCLFAAFWYSKRRIASKVQPIAEAVESLGRGSAVSLDARGELADLAESANRASDLLRRQEEARANWIAGVSHDIRTPLSLITVYADQVATDGRADEGVVEKAARIGAQSLRIGNLVNDLNLISQLDCQNQSIRTESIRLSRIVRSSVAEAMNAMKDDAHTVDIEVEAEAEDAVIEGDERLLCRAFANILNNSIVHNPEGCAIHVTERRYEDRVCISFEDDGIGASESKIRELNDGRHYPNRMDDNALGPRHGLGLLIVSRAMESHGASMEIASSETGGFGVLLTFPCDTPSLR